MRCFLFLIATFAASSSFAQLESLGEKSEYINSKLLERKNVCKLFQVVNRQGHPTKFTEESIPPGKKLVLGVFSADCSEKLFVVENMDDVNAVIAPNKRANYYLIDENLL